MYTILLDINRMKVLVIGGGQVALRRVRKLLANGAYVTILSPSLVPELKSILESNQNLRWIPSVYETCHLNDYRMVFVCSNDPVVNEKAATEAQYLGILVNRADEPSKSNFILPATTTIGALELSFSTGGMAPFLSSYIRQHMEAEFARFDSEYIELLSKIREQLIQTDREDRREILYSLLDKSQKELEDYYMRLVAE